MRHLLKKFYFNKRDGSFLIIFQTVTIRAKKVALIEKILF
jgi:hypothetical protein